MKRALFSDLDGTLCFHEEAHGVRAIGAEPDGALLIEDPSGRRWRGRDVSTSSYRIYVADETLRLLRACRERFAIVLVTGGRPSTVERRRALFDFASAFILENGGLVCGPDLARDEAWWDRLEPQRRLLPEMARRLTDAGWRLDADGRTSGIRVRLRDNPARSAGELAALCRDLVPPPGLRKTVNLENLDIILADAGKENAARFWRESRGYAAEDCVGIGDDENDLAFLRECGRAYVLGSSYPGALLEARRAGWHVSSAGHIAGINEILAALAAG